jgi:hypothetical protein
MMGKAGESALEIPSGALMLGAVPNASQMAEEALLKSADVASSTTTTLAMAFESQILGGIPVAEVVLALSLTLVVGLCIGLLLKKRRFL